MSMTREKAIKALEQADNYVGIHYINGVEDPYISPYLKEAINIALSALRPVSREQVEKAWRGEWQYHPEDYDELTWTCSRCGEVWTLIDGTPDDNNMDFCPACGSPMTDDAVEMVMERLEALYDTSN